MIKNNVKCMEIFKKRLDKEFEKILLPKDFCPMLDNLIELMKTLRTNPVTSHLIETFEDKNLKEKKKFNSLTLQVVEEEFYYRWPLPYSKECRKKFFFLRSPQIGKTENIMDSYSSFIGAILGGSTHHPIGTISHFFAFIDFPPNTSEKIRNESPLQKFWDSNQNLIRNGYLNKDYVRKKIHCDFSFLWRMLCLLEEICTQKRYAFLSVPKQTVLKNKEPLDREYNWNLAIQRSHLFNLHVAINSIVETFLVKTLTEYTVCEEYLFTFEDIKNCIDLLQRELDLFLLSQLETVTEKDDSELQEVLSKKLSRLEKKVDSSSLTKRTRRKIDEVQRHAIKYRKKNPKAKNREIYHDYFNSKVHLHPYTYERWRRDITKKKLKKRQEKW